MPYLTAAYWQSALFFEGREDLGLTVGNPPYDGRLAFILQIFLKFFYGIYPGRLFMPEF